jgi:2-C-methyl-D-erythritol 4-phosphate cytidylyltransferase
MRRANRIWVLIPAAGVGRRMSAALPKQYLALLDRTVLEWSLAPFLKNAAIGGIAVGHAQGDERIGGVRDVRIRTFVGGVERADTVLRGLDSLAANEHASDADWVLIHDAARPCLHEDDLSRLIAELSSDEVGGLLACPVSDTIKSADPQGRVAATVSREHLWRALTPQMFRFGLLRRALLAAREKNLSVTDESAAVEALGYRPKLVVGRGDNIKITVPEDLSYAEYVLRARTAP